MTVKKKILFLIFLLIILLIGICLGKKTSIFEKTLSQSDCKNEYNLLNPTVACDLLAEEKLETVKNLETKINDYISYSKGEKKILEASVFFRDLSSKKWVGIKQNEKYAPASLLKLPLLIAYFKLSEIEPDLFSKKYTFTKVNPIFYQNIKPKVELQEGKEYTLEEILKQMIVYSDNSAMDFLWSAINRPFADRIFYELGITYGDDTEENFLSPIVYSNILRMLYNSSYLTRDSSEKILTLLTETDFNNGLVAGVPSGIAVAHKFGERDISSTSKELHDCGIIYYPEHPYILCVMTIGDNYDNLEGVISNISKITYEEYSKISGY
jgi:beta-lactamase class A